MAQQNREQYDVQTLTQKGRQLYGIAFEEVYAGYLALKPSMRASDAEQALQALVRPIEPDAIRDRAYRAGVTLSFVNPNLPDPANFKQVGYALARMLSQRASWFESLKIGGKARNPETLLIGLDGLELLMMDALQECGLVSIGNDGGVGHTPVHVGFLGYGRRVHTAYGEAGPGADPGYSPCSLPPL